ncbi:MAG: hypothetical protein LBO09_03470 [Candidatus Peribacteria bacterium]|nr:hypothetical protein [Candidatus Peribacteria bacterium]
MTNLDNQKEQDLFFQTGTQYFPLIGKYQLSYISATPQNEAEVFIIFTDGDVFQLFPQSSVKFTEELFPEI